MLTRRDALFLRKFLTAAYADLGDPEPGDRARKILRDLADLPTRPQAVAEVARQCDREQFVRGTMSLRTDLVREILAHFLSQQSDATETALRGGDPPPSFWAAYERRHTMFEGAARREAESLRLLDRCPALLLFTFYDPPAEDRLIRRRLGGD